jgi:hypothetical protein
MKGTAQYFASMAEKLWADQAKKRRSIVGDAIAEYFEAKSKPQAVVEVVEPTVGWRANPIESRRAYRQRLSVAMDGEIAALAKELKRQGVAAPITQARNKLAPQWGFAGGASLQKWLQRNR